MTNNKEKKVLNVPNLRFPEFTDKWEAGKLEEYILLVSGQDLSSEQYTDKEDVYPYITGASSLNSEGIILNRWTHTPTQIVKRGDILLVCKGSGVGQLTVLSNVDKAHIARQIMGIRAKNTESQLFIYHYLSRLMTELKKRSTGIIPGIDRKSILSLHISIPSLQEQQKVAELLSLIEQRIITQNKIIEKLQSLIKGIAQHCIKESTSGNTYVKLGDICQITTGKLDANAQVDNGIYPFFTCAEQPFKIDSFAFDTEALLISGNGANLGYINYYHGKFNAYQRTYVLDTFSENIQYIKWALKVLLPKRIAIEKSSSNTPYIVLSTLSDLRLPIPNKSNQCHIAKLMQSLERKLSSQTALNGSYNRLKQYLLRQMFI